MQTIEDLITAVYEDGFRDQHNGVSHQAIRDAFSTLTQDRDAKGARVIVLETALTQIANLKRQPFEDVFAWQQRARTIAQAAITADDGAPS